MSVPNREGKTYRNRRNDAIVVVLKSLRMSAGTTRHTVLVLDPGTSTVRRSAEQVEIDEVPVQKWDSNWEEV